MVTSLRRIFKAGFVGFWRNAYVSLASIFVITIALFVIGSTILIDQLLGASLVQLQAKVDINVYFVTTAPQEEIDALIASVNALPDVEKVTYTSRDDALAEYRAKNQNDSVAMQALDELRENPLGATIAVQAKEASQYESINRYLEEQKSPIIDEINYTKNKESIGKLSSIIGAVEQASFVALMVLIMASVLITFNTIRLAIFTAKEEISIMRLVGAGNMYIRGPFMLQGVMYGVISGVLALLILYPIVLWLGPKTAQFFEINIFDYFVNNFAYIFLVLIGIGVALGLVSSVLAITRYLRV
jgi:cell division transport system permease protein